MAIIHSLIYRRTLTSSSYSLEFALKSGFTHSVMSLEYFLSSSSSSCILWRSISLPVCFHISVSMSSLCWPRGQNLKIFLFRQRERRNHFRNKTGWKCSRQRFEEYSYLQFVVPHDTCRCQEEKDDAQDDERCGYIWKMKDNFRNETLSAPIYKFNLIDNLLTVKKNSKSHQNICLISSQNKSHYT